MPTALWAAKAAQEIDSRVAQRPDKPKSSHMNDMVQPSASPRLTRRKAVSCSARYGLRMSDTLSFELQLEQFEDFCVVTESVRRGFPVAVQVLDAGGQSVFRS
jgi:hypothetical protein